MFTQFASFAYTEYASMKAATGTNINRASINKNNTISKKWYKSTFQTLEDSMNYHLKEHGKGRTIEEYTNDAYEFFNKNKKTAVKVTLRDETKGLKIQTGSGKNRKGGYWTKDGRIVTFWD